jgi:acid phosphatase
MHHVLVLVLYALALVSTALTLFHLFDWSMISPKAVLPLLWIPIATASNASVDLGWHAPKKSWINNLEKVLNGSGTNGFVFSGSQLPAGTPYGTYNWCNMPHVRSDEYLRASAEYKLQYVEV